MSRAVRFLHQPLFRNSADFSKNFHAGKAVTASLARWPVAKMRVVPTYPLAGGTEVLAW
jgi:hypothetical protein